MISELPRSARPISVITAAAAIIALVGLSAACAKQGGEGPRDDHHKDDHHNAAVESDPKGTTDPQRA